MNQPTTPPGAGRGPYELLLERFHGRYSDRVGGGSYLRTRTSAFVLRVGLGIAESPGVGRDGVIGYHGESRQTYPQSAGAQLREDNPADSSDEEDHHDSYDDAPGRGDHGWLSFCVCRTSNTMMQVCATR